MSENISEVLLFTYIPFVLLVLILLSNKPKEETRDIKFYWGNRIQERINLKDNKLLPLLYWIITIGVILLLTVIFLFMGNLKIVDISKISYILPISKGKEVFVTDLAVASAYSLVLALKKKIYLGISIQDVLNNTFLPDILQFISINSIIIMIGIGVYRIEYMAGSLKLLIVIVTKITYWLWNLNILCLFCEMVRMFTRVTKSELKAFNALRYRINDCYKIENENIVNEIPLKAISEYLLEKIQKEYIKIAGKDKEIDKVKIKSRKIEKNKWITLSCSVWMSITVIIFIGMGLLMHFWGNTNVPISFVYIILVITVLLFVIGSWKNVWADLFQDKIFYIFKQGKKKKIVMRGSNPIWKKRYEVIESIQDLMGLYKILLDNDIRERDRNVIIQTIDDYIESEKLRNVLKLLICYLEYSNVFSRISSSEDIAKFQTTINTNKKVKKISLEYTLSNAVLCEIYKNAMIKNGSKNYQKLGNKKFDSMIEYINKCIDAKNKHHR